MVRNSESLVGEVRSQSSAAAGMSKRNAEIGHRGETGSRRLDLEIAIRQGERNALANAAEFVERPHDALGGNVSEARSPLTAQWKREACREMRNSVNILSRQRWRAGGAGRDGPALHRLAIGGETQAATELGNGT